MAAFLTQSARAFDIVAAQYGSSTAGFPYAVAMAKGFFKQSGADVTGGNRTLGNHFGGGGQRRMGRGGGARHRTQRARRRVHAGRRVRGFRTTQRD